MAYKGESVMDCGYFVGGHPDGLMYFPPPATGVSPPQPVIIPWDYLLNDDPPPNQVEITDAD